MLNVADRGRTVGALRYIAVRLMETTAAWTPLTPEMEVKVMFGKHIWQFAQHADQLGKRTFELRRPPQFSLSPVDAYVALLTEVGDARDTTTRLASLYDVLLPGLERRCRRYIEETDPILDGPSVVILERILRDLAKQHSEANEVRKVIGTETCDTEDLRKREEAIASFVPAQG